MSNNSIVIFVYRKIANLESIFTLVNNNLPPKIYLIIDQAENSTIRNSQEKILTFINSFSFNVPIEIIRPKSHLGINKIFDFGLGKVFEKEEQAIILEDDTIPSTYFFEFCNLMLRKFKNDTSVGCINGCNLESSMISNGYFLSELSLPFWGWATWKNRWPKKLNNYDFWTNYRITNIQHNNRVINAVSAIYDRFVAKDKSWDVRWSMFLLASQQRTVLPAGNLVINKGFTNEATFTNIPNSDFSKLELMDKMVDFQLEIENQEVYIDKINLLIKDMSLRKTTHETTNF